VNSVPRFLPRVAALALCAAALIPICACRRSGVHVLETAYVSGVQVYLRDRVAPVYQKVVLVKNGDRVEVLDHDRHFVKVRAATGQIGWIEQRYLVSQQVFDRLQKLLAENANDPVQAQGVARNDTNLHVDPGRETEHLYQISSGEKLSLLKRGTAEKSGSAPAQAHAATSAGMPAEKSGETSTPKQGETKPAETVKSTENKSAENKSSGSAATEPSASHPVLEDWYLVRDSHARVGWVLARMVDLDVPLEVAQYAEGQRILAFFTLNDVPDQDKKVLQYLMVLTDPKDGLPFDFNQFRVFTWNTRRHRYETAYRERIEGMLPVAVSKEDFGKEGTLPVFTVRVLGDDGKTSERKYKLNTPIVRRVYAPGEEPTRTSARKAATGKPAHKTRKKH